MHYGKNSHELGVVHNVSIRLQTKEKPIIGWLNHYSTYSTVRDDEQ